MQPMFVFPAVLLGELFAVVVVGLSAVQEHSDDDDAAAGSSSCGLRSVAGGGFLSPHSLLGLLVYRIRSRASVASWRGCTVEASTPGCRRNRLSRADPALRHRRCCIRPATDAYGALRAPNNATTNDCPTAGEAESRGGLRPRTLWGIVGAL